MQKIVDDYGMVLVLIALCVLFSILTLAPQIPSQDASVQQLVDLVCDECQIQRRGGCGRGGEATDRNHCPRGWRETCNKPAIARSRLSWASREISGRLWTEFPQPEDTWRPWPQAARS